MVCVGTAARGRYGSPSSSMWAVVVLGIITAVFAWVWFGGRGSENKRSETQEEQQNTEIIDKGSAKTDPQEAEKEERSVTFQKDSPETREKRPGAVIEAESTPGEASLNQKGQELKCKDDDVYGQDDHLSKKSQKMKEHVTLVSTDPKLSPPTDPKLPTSTDPKVSPPTDPKLPTSTDPKVSHPTDPKLPTSTDPKVSPPTDPKLPTSTDPKQSPPTDPKLPTSTDPKQSPPTDPKLPTSTDPKQSPPTDPKQSPPTDPKLPLSTDSKLATLEDPKPVTSTDPKQVPPPESKVEDLQNSREDLHYFIVPEKKVVQISQDILKTTAKEDLVKTQVEVSQTTGSEEQGLQVIENVSTSDKEEVGKVTVEELRPSVIEEEKLEKTMEETSNFNVPEKVQAISTEVVTEPKHLDRVHDGGVKLVNGSEEHVQTKIATVNPKEEVASHLPLNVTDSPKQVNRSSSQNTFDHYNHNKLDKWNYAVDEKPSDTMESAAGVQVNGHNLLSEESLPTNIEDVVLTSPTVDTGNVHLHSSSQEEESLRDTKLQDSDLHRTKRVAAVQPIPQNVSLDFKVHYITQSDSQMIAVTGDHEKLGEWENYVPLNCNKDGYWLHSVTLPADANVEWKFVMVENGKIKRWEECSNRHIRTAHEDIATQQWWGYP